MRGHPASSQTPKVETNERDGKSQWITVRVWIGTHPTCQTCRPVLTGGKLHFGAALIHPLGVSMYSVRRVPAWPSAYRFPQGEALDLFKIFPFDRFGFALHFARSHTPWCGLFLPPFAVSHDLTHLGRKVREHIPLKKISHALGTRTGQYYWISH